LVEPSLKEEVLALSLVLVQTLSYYVVAFEYKNCLTSLSQKKQEGVEEYLIVFVHYRVMKLAE
jgi:hypothetical protein